MNRASAALLQLRQGALGRDEVEALQYQVLDVAPVPRNYGIASTRRRRCCPGRITANGRPYSIAARSPEDESRGIGWEKPLEALWI